jgi:hypothetical protein
MVGTSWYQRKADECALSAANSDDPRHRSRMEAEQTLEPVFGIIKSVLGCFQRRCLAGAAGAFGDCPRAFMVSRRSFCFWPSWRLPGSNRLMRSALAERTAEVRPKTAQPARWNTGILPAHLKHAASTRISVVSYRRHVPAGRPDRSPTVPACRPAYAADLRAIGRLAMGARSQC